MMRAIFWAPTYPSRVRSTSSVFAYDENEYAPPDSNFQAAVKIGSDLRFGLFCARDISSPPSLSPGIEITEASLPAVSSRTLPVEYELNPSSSHDSSNSLL